MPASGRAEIYFIVAMMLLTFILSGFAMYFFVRTYKREMREREVQREAKRLRALSETSEMTSNQRAKSEA
jgi:flagellar basal body-associated protein FliL